MSLSVNLVKLPYADISIAEYTKDSKGKSATVEKLLKLLTCQLEGGIGIFIYTKKDGTMRKAIGTTAHGYIPAPMLSKIQSKKPDTSKINYYDLEAQDWRAFTPDSLVGVVLFD